MMDPQLERAAAGSSPRPDLDDQPIGRDGRPPAAQLVRPVPDQRPRADRPLGAAALVPAPLSPGRGDGRFRVYLFSAAAVPVGYGALLLKDGELHVTECVAAEYRGRGAGRAILERLIAVAHHEGRDLVAEIWSSNRPSVGLHEKAGFVLERTREHGGESLSIYRLTAPG